MRLRGYRFASYSRTVGVSYSREILGDKLVKCLYFSLWFGAVFIQSEREAWPM